MKKYNNKLKIKKVFCFKNFLKLISKKGDREVDYLPMKINNFFSKLW